MADDRRLDPPGFDPVWEQKYAAGHAERYPWDSVVSFVYHNAPRGLPHGEAKIVEVGCGTASNLWFAAREGFQVWGVDGSASAIAAARQRFKDDGLAGTLEVADFTRLPHPDAQFHLAIDRAAITCVGLSAAAHVVGEVRRVLLSGGRFFFNPYSDRHSSYRSGQLGPDGLRLGITEGSLVGVGQICFYGQAQVEALFAKGWRVLSMQHMESTEKAGAARPVHAEWRVIAEKIP
ncbi:MAG: class I SAM-dependent methyltransferase [Betaproteobacteria bacterium]|nr:class I SAM-dependent methyltransferase [Betaproteobacteria bacterium]